MLLAVIASSYVTRVSPIPLPVPLVQIGLGVLISAVTTKTAELDPHIFFFLFLPPLLFLDGWRIPKAGLFHDKVIVVGLAFGLVFFTVIGAGYVIYWLIPAMPLAVAFALAAVVSPTDPVAVSSIVSRGPMPKRLMHILEGESLLNDAAGLLCFNFAVLAAMTGAFSLHKASLTFAWLVAAGLAAGVGVTLGVAYLQRWLSRHWGEESGAAILMNLLTPFGAYLFAELLHGSGILAAVSAGITMSYVEMTGRALAITRVQRAAVWDMVRFALNGIMFVLLGEQLPAIVGNAAAAVNEVGQRSSLWLIVYALVITVILGVLRYAWVWMSLQALLLRARLTGQEVQHPGSRIVAIMSLSGVRGAITLAGVLSLPLFLSDGTPFPARDSAIFLAAVVILFSLIAASVLLPWLLGGPNVTVPEGTEEEREEEAAFREAACAAIKAVDDAGRGLVTDDALEAELYAQAVLRVIETYKFRLTPEEAYVGSDGQSLRAADRIEMKLRIAAWEAERRTLQALARNGRISDVVLRRLMRKIDFAEEIHRH
ncbi:MAG: Na+/H+ antiporter [Azoarcus sp.]|nr:Na+/H+ antiporter [Azoarcus sp.]